MKFVSKITSNGSTLILNPCEHVKPLIDGRYEVTIKPYKKDRSKNSNAYMWAIIKLISDETGQNDWDIYLEALEQAGVLYTYLEVIPEAVDALKRVFRIVSVLENRVSLKNRSYGLMQMLCWFK